MARERRHPLFDDKSRHVDRFGVLLTLVSAAVIVLSLVDLGTGVEDPIAAVGLMAVTLFVGLTFLVALRASGVSRRYTLIADVLISLGIVANLLVILLAFAGEGDPRSSSELPSPLWLLLAAVAPLIVIRRLIHHRRATGQTLLGAVSAYLLIAMSFDFIFLTISGYQNTPFFGSEEPTTSYMYYSLVTVTTLGYGDLSAVTEAGRLASTIEAVIGQVYLVTFVGMVVGLLVAQRQSDREETRAIPRPPGEEKPDSP